MHPVSPGEPGLLVVKSAAQMSGYVDEPAATESVLHEGWYLGLGDVVFYLTNPDTKRIDYYWVSRSAGLLIRGGANYSCVQLESELKEFVTGQLGWREDGFDLAVVGHKLGSEHEDSCCTSRVARCLERRSGKTCNRVQTRGDEKCLKRSRDQTTWLLGRYRKL